MLQKPVAANEIIIIMICCLKILWECIFKLFMSHCTSGPECKKLTCVHGRFLDQKGKCQLCAE